MQTISSHQLDSVSFTRLDYGPAVSLSGGEGFLTKHMNASFGGSYGEFSMESIGTSDIDGIDFSAAQDGAVTLIGRDDWNSVLSRQFSLFLFIVGKESYQFGVARRMRKCRQHRNLSDVP